MSRILLGLVALTAVAFAEVNLNLAGEELYKKCAGCHGLKAEKKALGKSLIVADMNVTEISTALLGYKDGSYGRSMKGIMKSQTTNMSPVNIHNLAEYIISFKKIN